jgi:hypothetical protein
MEWEQAVVTFYRALFGPTYRTMDPDFGNQGAVFARKFGKGLP